MNPSREILLDMKNKAETMLQIINDLEKKTKTSNKYTKQAKKVISKFIKCNITSDAIYKRYHEVILTMERFAIMNQEG